MTRARRTQHPKTLRFRVQGGFARAFQLTESTDPWCGQSIPVPCGGIAYRASVFLTGPFATGRFKISRHAG